ncbi:hypothetical protein [Saccharibacillus sacchari]|uniref:hypothetical protein n=1 Tax=Saccharibacillus sacchari TaxID=456493 RepID=UPI0004AF2978|nr:hypothetical protein [Saccharibacillus sacchari]
MEKDRVALQPLRIPSGWRVEVNELREIDPSPETMDWFYGSILLSVLHRHLGYELYVRWEPEGDPSGCYVLQRYRLKFEKKGNGVLEAHFVDEQQFEERRLLVEQLEAYMDLKTWS